MAIMPSRGKGVSFKLTSRQGYMLFTLLVAVTSVTCDGDTSNAVNPSRAVFSPAAQAPSMTYDGQLNGISWVKDLKHLKEDVRLLIRAVDKLSKLEIAQISMMEALSESVARISSRIGGKVSVNMDQHEPIQRSPSSSLAPRSLLSPVQEQARPAETRTPTSAPHRPLSPTLNSPASVGSHVSPTVLQTPGTRASAAPAVSTCTTLSITVDNDMELYLDGIRALIPNSGDWRTVKSVQMHYNTRVIAVKGIDWGVVAGILASTLDGRVMTNQTWKCTADTPPADWAMVEFDDRAWPAAVVSYRNFNTSRWGTMGGISTSAWWIWTGPPSSSGPGFRPVAYCRFRA